MKRILIPCVLFMLAVVAFCLAPASAERGTPAPPATPALHSNPYPYALYLPSLWTYAKPTPTVTASPSATPTWTPGPTMTPTSTATATGTATPTLTPTPCYGETQVLLEPGFETDENWMVGLGNPSRTSDNAFSGSYSTWFCGTNSDEDSLHQYVTVPDWAETGAVYFAWYMVSEDSLSFCYDKFTLKIWDMYGGIVRMPVICSYFDRNQWTVHRASLGNVTALRGHPLDVVLRAQTNATLPTGWYIDDVRLVFACGGYIP